MMIRLKRSGNRVLGNEFVVLPNHITRLRKSEIRWSIMNQPDDKATREQILQLMTTEHFTLQPANAATVAEANGRAALYLGSVSSAVVALAFIGQVSRMGEAFFLFGLVLFPSIFFLGIVTFDRVIQTALDD